MNSELSPSRFRHDREPTSRGESLTARVVSRELVTPAWTPLRTSPRVGMYLRWYKGRPHDVRMASWGLLARPGD
jgi:hypothetical protein